MQFAESGHMYPPFSPSPQSRQLTYPPPHRVTMHQYFGAPKARGIKQPALIQ